MVILGITHCFDMHIQQAVISLPIQLNQCQYVLTTNILEAPEKVASLRVQAGCFVLLSNLVEQQVDWPADELLKLYKSQIGIEKNFSFLKDPVIVNSIFLG